MNKKDLITPNTTSLIYNIIRHSGEINRMGVTEKSGASKSTVSLQISKLLKLGMIEEKTPTDSSQRKLKLKIREDIGMVAGVFLGITKLSIILFSLDMKIQHEKIFYFESIANPERCNDEIMGQLKSLCREKGIENLWGIGIGFPFPVNFHEGIPDSPPNVPLWDGYPLKDIYEKEFGCPVLVDNDVNVMALGEGCMGCTVNESNFLFIKVGTGIGSGLIVNGSIYRGANGCAGDIGHISVNGSDENCICGNRGCLEAIASGRALAEKARDLASSGQSPFLAARAAEGVSLNSSHINEGAMAGDLACIHLIRETGKSIGEVTAKLVNFFNPSSIVIGGGLTGFGNLFIGAIRETIIRRSPHLATYELNICFSELKDKSGPTGAGALILDHIFSEDEFSETVRERLYWL